MMGTEIFQIGPKGAEKMEIKDSTCILKLWPEPECTDSLRPDNDFGPLYSLDPIFSTISGANHKVPVPIGKLMTRGFQNTPYFWILLKSEGAIALYNKAYFLWDTLNSVYSSFGHDFRMQVESFISSFWAPFGQI